MDLAEGDTLLVLVEEHADEAQGWIFAAKAAEAGYVPRTYLELAADDAPAKAPTPAVTDSSGGEEILEPVTQPRAESPPHPLVPPLPIAGSPPETAQSPAAPGRARGLPLGHLPARRHGARGDRGHGGGRPGAPGRRGLRGGPWLLRGCPRRRKRRVGVPRRRAQRSWRWTPTACPGMSSGGAGDEDGEGDRERQLADENAELKRRLARARARLGGQQGAPWQAATTTTRHRRGRRGRTRRGPATRCTTSSRTSSRSAGLRRAV